MDRAAMGDRSLVAAVSAPFAHRGYFIPMVSHGQCILVDTASCSGGDQEGGGVMREIWIDAPRVVEDRIEFSLRVEPQTTLYHRTTFFLRFPHPIEPASFPDRLVWLMALLCLHPHWTLLRPCRVHLPVRLGEGEKELWLRLLDATVATLEGNRRGRRAAERTVDIEPTVESVGRTIEIVEHGAPLADVLPLPERGLCAAA